MRKIVMTFIILAMLGFLALFTYDWLKEKMPNFDRVELEEYYQGELESHLPVILEDKVIKDKAALFEERLYLELEFVQDQIDDYYYWDEGEEILTYTTLTEWVQVPLGETHILVNEVPTEKEYPVLIETEYGFYIALDFVKAWSDINAVYFLEPARLVLEEMGKEHQVGEVVAEKAYLREEPTDKSLVIYKLLKGDKVTIYGEEDDWYYVRSSKGWLGYVPKEKIQDIFIEAMKIKEVYLNKSYLPDDKITLVWHQVTNYQGNEGLEALMDDTTGINVLSPTWFKIVDETGQVSNIGDYDYVQWAHERGIEVWPLVDNQFSATLTHEVLQSTNKRKMLIESLIKEVNQLGADGINIDFENVAEEDGEAFVQFMRELAIRCYQEALTLSVDTYVPRSWTAHYNRKELGKVVDYLMIMAYDEHWSTSPVSGSVASIGFVEDGIIQTLLEVPNEKVVLGLPFYTRLWKEEEVEGEVKVSSSAYSMTYALQLLEEKGADILWNDKTAQYYGEYMEGNSRYRIWLEEEKSIEEKLKLFVNYELTGIAGWKLGLEKEEVWPIIEAYLEN